MPCAATDVCPKSTGRCVGCRASCYARCSCRCISERCSGMLGHQSGIRQSGAPKWYRSEAPWGKWCRGMALCAGCRASCNARCCEHIRCTVLVHVCAVLFVLPCLILDGTHLQSEPELKSPGASRSTACIVLGLYEAYAVATRVSEGLISYALFLVPMYSASFTLKSWLSPSVHVHGHRVNHLVGSLGAWRLTCTWHVIGP